MLQISEQSIQQIRHSRTFELASRIFGALPELGSVDVALHYVNAAIAAGIQTERDIAEFTMLMFPVDRAGRPAAIDELVRDPRTDGALKLFQISYALHGERR